MCAPLFATDELPELPEPEAALKRLCDAELARLYVAIELERGRVIQKHTCRDAEARLVRLTAEVDRYRVELEQALIAQARGERFIGRPSSALIIEAMQTRLRQNISLQAVEARSARQASAATPCAAE